MKGGFEIRGQIWVETVIYTLIALVIIGTVISIVQPKIEASRDQALIEQSIGMVKNIDSIFTDIKQAPGNQRVIELNIKKGNLIIDAASDKIIFQIDSSYVYSEPGQEVEDSASGITAYTQKLGKVNNVTLTKDYSADYNITYFGKDETKTLTAASNSYKATILNQGHYFKVDEASSCNSGDDLSVVCTNPAYQDGFSKYCVGNKCKYIQDVSTINIEIN